jgi:hypothetical protein
VISMVLIGTERCGDIVVIDFLPARVVTRSANSTYSILA